MCMCVCVCVCVCVSFGDLGLKIYPYKSVE